MHRTTQKLGRVRAVPRLCGFYPGICLTTEEKARKNFSQGSHTEGIERTSFCRCSRAQGYPVSVFDRIERASLYLSFILALNYTNTPCSLCQQWRPSLSEGPTRLGYFCLFSVWRREQTKRSKRRCKISPRRWTMLNTLDKLTVMYLGQNSVYLSYWHGYVLHECTAYHGRAPRISQMTSRLLRHTAAAMRAHNVLCNSYDNITVEMNRCSFRRVRFALLYIVTRSKIV
jgi:hypothetical protein